MERNGVCSLPLSSRAVGSRAPSTILRAGCWWIIQRACALHPLLQSLPVERDPRGALIVDSTFAAKGFENVWALGDCANIPDARTQQPCPPTAQYARREAKQLAKNMHARVHGKPITPFAFQPLGISCVVRHQTACLARWLDM